MDAVEVPVVEVRAEFAANVWQVPAVVGQAVAAGDVIAVLESMKMEIEVQAPVDGTIVSVHVMPDQPVAGGDLLAVIEAG